MSIIGMRNMGGLLVDCEPMDWLLYNKIVGFLRNERPGGNGMYTSSIVRARGSVLAEKYQGELCTRLAVLIRRQA